MEPYDRVAERRGCRHRSRFLSAPTPLVIEFSSNQREVKVCLHQRWYSRRNRTAGRGVLPLCHIRAIAWPPPSSAFMRRPLARGVVRLLPSSTRASADHRPSFTQRSFAPGACCYSPILAPMTSAASLLSTTRLPLLVIRVALPCEYILAGQETIPVSPTTPCRRASSSTPGSPMGAHIQSFPIGNSLRLVMKGSALPVFHPLLWVGSS